MCIRDRPFTIGVTPPNVCFISCENVAPKTDCEKAANEWNAVSKGSINDLNQFISRNNQCPLYQQLAKDKIEILSKTLQPPITNPCDLAANEWNQKLNNHNVVELEAYIRTHSLCPKYVTIARDKLSELKPVVESIVAKYSAHTETTEFCKELFSTRNRLFFDYSKMIGVIDRKARTQTIYASDLNSFGADKCTIQIGHLSTDKLALSCIFYTHSSKKIKKTQKELNKCNGLDYTCLLYTSPSPRDATLSRMPSSA